MHHENSLIHTTGGGQYVMGDEKYQKWYTIDALGAIFAVFNNSNTFHNFNNTLRSQESQNNSWTSKNLRSQNNFGILKTVLPILLNVYFDLYFDITWGALLT